MGVTEHGEVKLLHKSKNIHDWPYWVKGRHTDNEGYFTLQYYKRVGTFYVPVLTRSLEYSMNRLTIKGKKPLRWIPPSYLIVDYYFFSYIIDDTDKTSCPTLGDLCTTGILTSGKCVQGVCQYGKSITKYPDPRGSCSM